MNLSFSVDTSMKVFKDGTQKTISSGVPAFVYSCLSLNLGWHMPVMCCIQPVPGLESWLQSSIFNCLLLSHTGILKLASRKITKCYKSVENVSIIWRGGLLMHLSLWLMIIIRMHWKLCCVFLDSASNKTYNSHFLHLVMLILSPLRNIAGWKTSWENIKREKGPVISVTQSSHPQS